MIQHGGVWPPGWWMSYDLRRTFAAMEARQLVRRVYAQCERGWTYRVQWKEDRALPGAGT
jgi:hypothetical protein